MADPCIDDVPVEQVKAPWNGKKWTETYHAHEDDAVKNQRPLWRDENLSKDRLLAAATTMFLSQGNTLKGVSEDGTEYEVPPPDFSQCVSKFFKEEYAPLKDVERVFPETRVRIVNVDVVDFVRALMDRYEAAGVSRKVIALNMANQFNPGGGFVRGRLAQEEALCFRTGLYTCLDKKEYEGPNGFGDFTASLQLNVPVLRKGMDQGFEFLKPEERWTMDIVSAAGYDRHKLPKEEQRAPLSPEQYAGVFTKVNAILSAAAHAGAQCVVLGSLGCGAFANPPEQISEIFAKVIRRFAGVFEYVYFAILAGPGDVKLKWFQQNLVGKPVDDPATYYLPSLAKEDEEAKSAIYKASEEFDLPSGKLLPPCPLMSECKDESKEHRCAFEHHPFPPFHPTAAEDK